jgi:hypothetical protein
MRKATDNIAMCFGLKHAAIHCRILSAVTGIVAGAMNHVYNCVTTPEQLAVSYCK